MLGHHQVHRPLHCNVAEVFASRTARPMAASNSYTSKFTHQAGRCRQCELWHLLPASGLDRPSFQMGVELTEAALASEQPLPARQCLLYPPPPPPPPPLGQASALSPEVCGWHLAKCAADESHHTAARVCLEEVPMVTVAGAEVVLQSPRCLERPSRCWLVLQSIVHCCCCFAALRSTTPMYSA